MDNLRDLEQQLSAEGYTAQHFLLNALEDVLKVIQCVKKLTSIKL
jgi:hypothetical protein